MPNVWDLFSNVNRLPEKVSVSVAVLGNRVSSADSPASGSHLLLFDPCRNKQGVKDKCLWGRGENLFSSICLSMSIRHIDEFLRDRPQLFFMVCFVLVCHFERKRETLGCLSVCVCVCVRAQQKRLRSIQYTIPRSLMFSLGLFLSV